MATRTTKASARERLLEAANELFYSEGVQTVGIDRVIEHAGVAKASLYNTFGSKEGLVCAYLELRNVRIRDRITRTLTRFRTPREQLLGVFDAQGEAFTDPEYNGCAFMRATAETPEDSAIRRAADSNRAWVRGRSRNWPPRPDMPPPRSWPANCTCSTTAHRRLHGWTAIPPLPQQHAPLRPSCSTRRRSPSPRPLRPERHPLTVRARLPRNELSARAEAGAAEGKRGTQVHASHGAVFQRWHAAEKLCYTLFPQVAAL
ncbi:TetR/AcrR family transcriptional regulator [Streptomyces sp. CA-106110]|uniref:TetR/AcrR family transcriptional regulator n=1 Tax=Streptomyces sp. CA-106110 TaxID=3240044 RepID=UPI003D8C6774